MPQQALGAVAFVKLGQLRLILSRPVAALDAVDFSSSNQRDQLPFSGARWFFDVFCEWHGFGIARLAAHFWIQQCGCMSFTTVMQSSVSYWPYCVHR
mmetsp:Transcript_135361/g.306261  ORF Transcript_135361/g.306261 Transcript_135361/m.306261 type:complete len:97 (-) Transcript_135361:41-331(-)